MSLVLIISDTHLGAMKSKYELLYIFLDKINSGAYGANLKALIFLGDAFDLIMASPKKICEFLNFRNIFLLLDDIQQNGIDIYFTPGNHEIPIWGNQDTNFKKRKEKLLRKFEKAFQKNNIPWNILNPLHVCQYLVIDKNTQNLQITCYDMLEEIIKSTPISDSNIYPVIWNGNISNFRALLSHGHQTDPIEIIANPFWGIGLHFPNVLKRFGNIIWNGIIKGGYISRWKRDRKTKKGHIDKNFKLDEDSTRKILITSRFSKEIIKSSRNIVLHLLEKMGVSNIRDFTLKLNDKLDEGSQRKITHFIYGHTHKEDKFNACNITVLNSGSWQRYTSPAIISIVNDPVAFKIDKFMIPTQLRFYNAMIISINQLIYMLGQILLVKNLKMKRYKFTAPEILRKSLNPKIVTTKNGQITKNDYEQIYNYYNWSLTNILAFDFNIYLNTIAPIYSSIYTEIKRLATRGKIQNPQRFLKTS